MLLRSPAVLGRDVRLVGHDAIDRDGAKTVAVAALAAMTVVMMVGWRAVVKDPEATAHGQAGPSQMP